ncbi:MAG: FHA domain-containing protein, partial [Planctomycetales bacterium]
MATMIESAAAAPGVASGRGVLLLEPVRNQLGIEPLALAPGRHVLGSDADCGIRLDLPGVAPRHCLIVVGEGKTVLRSWDRRTWLNDCLADETLLEPGDRLVIGPVEFRVRASSTELRPQQPRSSRARPSAARRDAVPAAAREVAYERRPDLRRLSEAIRQQAGLEEDYDAAARQRFDRLRDELKNHLGRLQEEIGRQEARLRYVLRVGGDALESAGREELPEPPIERTVRPPAAAAPPAVPAVAERRRREEQARLDNELRIEAAGHRAERDRLRAVLAEAQDRAADLAARLDAVEAALEARLAQDRRMQDREQDFVARQRRLEERTAQHEAQHARMKSWLTTLAAEQGAVQSAFVEKEVELHQRARRLDLLRAELERDATDLEVRARRISEAETRAA